MSFFFHYYNEYVSISINSCNVKWYVRNNIQMIWTNNNGWRIYASNTYDRSKAQQSREKFTFYNFVFLRFNSANITLNTLFPKFLVINFLKKFHICATMSCER